MNFKHLYRVLPIVFLLLWVSCAKEEDTGNKFQCLIDNQSWSFKPLSPMDSRLSAQMAYMNEKKTAHFIGVGTGASLELIVHDAGIIKVGNYLFNNLNVASVFKDGLMYTTDAQHTGKLTIKQLSGDPYLQFAEATFSFEAYNADNQKVLKISNGYFRIGN
jgi:hypothetical protein